MVGRFHFLSVALVLFMGLVACTLVGCGGGGGGSSSAPTVGGLNTTVMVPVKIRYEAGGEMNGIYAGIADGNVSSAWIKDPSGNIMQGSQNSSRDIYNRLTILVAGGNLLQGQYILQYIVGGNTVDYASGTQIEWVSFNGFTTVPAAPLWQSQSGTMIMTWSDNWGGRASYRIQIYNDSTNVLREEIDAGTNTTTSLYLSPTLRGIPIRIVLLADISDGGVPRARAIYSYAPQTYTSSNGSGR